MNAREIITLFKKRAPVIYCEPGKEPMRCNYISAVIFKHSPHSDRIAVFCDLPGLKEPVKGRHVKCCPEITMPKISGNKTAAQAEQIKQAFKDKVPVEYCGPNQSPVRCDFISAIIYRRHPQSGKIIVSCELPDSACPHCIIIARSKYVKILEKEVKKL